MPSDLALLQQGVMDLIRDSAGDSLTRFDAGVAVRDYAQSVIDAEKKAHEERLKKEVQELSAKLAANQAKLKDMGKLVGRPPDALKRKPRVRRGTLSPIPKATPEAQPSLPGVTE